MGPPTKKAAARCRGDGGRRKGKQTRTTYHSLAELSKILDLMQRPVEPSAEIVEREIYDGRRVVGVVRECHDGSFAASVHDQVIGRFDTIRDATDAVLSLGRPGGER